MPGVTGSSPVSSTIWRRETGGLAPSGFMAVCSFSSHFVVIHLLIDLSLAALSILQGAVYFCWRRQA